MSHLIPVYRTGVKEPVKLRLEFVHSGRGQAAHHAVDRMDDQPRVGKRDQGHQHEVEPLLAREVP